MLTLKELERKRIDKIKSLSADEVDRYLDVIFTDLMNIQDVDNVGSVDDPNIFNDDLDDLYSKLDEIRNLLGDNFRINDAIKTKAINYESVSHTGTKIKYSAIGFKLRMQTIRLLIRDILKEYGDLLNTLNHYYHFTLYQLDLDKIVSADDVSAKLVSEIDGFKLEINDMFYYDVIAGIETIKDDLKFIDKLFYSDEVLSRDIADLKNSIKDIADSDDYKDKLNRELGVLDAVVRLYDYYVEMQELKETYDEYKSEIGDLLESDNAFKRYSEIRYNDVPGDIPFDDFIALEPKFNMKECKLILP